MILIFFEVGVQPDINKYTVVNPFTAFRHEGDLIINSLGINYNADVYGQVLSKIDIGSGEKKWEKFNTYYNAGVQDYYRNILRNSEGQLELNGIKRNGPYTDTDPTFSYWSMGRAKSNCIRKKINYETGEIISLTSGQDSFDVVPVNTVHLGTSSDSHYLMIKNTGLQLDSTFIFGYEFIALDENCNLIDTLPLTNIWYETNDLVDFWSYGQPPFLQQLNDSIIVGLIFQDKLRPATDKAQLIWINIADINDIHVIKRANIGHLILGEASNYSNFIFQIKNDYIYIYHKDISLRMKMHIPCI